jgi:hypothetical protein
MQALVSDAVTASAQSTVFGVYFAAANGVGPLCLAVSVGVIQQVGFSAAFGVMAGCDRGAALLLIPCRRLLHSGSDA